MVTRRMATASLLVATAASAKTQDPFEQDQQRPRFPEPHDHPDDERLPNGKSQRDAIAEAEHKQALKDAQELVDLANAIKSDLDKAGSYVVPLGTVKKTEDIEKLAKRLRSRLRG